MNESAKHEAQAVDLRSIDVFEYQEMRDFIDRKGGLKRTDEFVLVRDLPKIIAKNAAPTDGVRRGMEMALAAIADERLHDSTGEPEDVAYDDAVHDCEQAVRSLIAALPAQDAAKDDAQESQDAKDAWISVNDRLPPPCGDVLVRERFAAYVHLGVTQRWGTRCAVRYIGTHPTDCHEDNITHWMPLPAPPALRDEAGKQSTASGASAGKPA